MEDEIPAQLHDADAERAVLASCLFSAIARKEARKVITGSDFYEPWHEQIWNAMSRLDRHSKDVDATIVHSILPNGSRAAEVVINLYGHPAMPENVATYAGLVHSWSVKRQIQTLATKVRQEVMHPDVTASGYAAAVVNRFAAIRDAGNTEDDFTAVTLRELLDEVDDEPDWLIPGLFERHDRLLLTGEEGLGKSHLLRQFAVHASAGAHPFDPGTRFRPIRTAIIDCENTRRQVRRKLRGTTEWVERYVGDPTENLMIDNLPRINITSDRDLSKVHQILDVWAPDLVVIGPLYRLYPKALQTDDDAAPVLAALDTIRDRGIAVCIEAHAGHAIGKGGERDLRPRGSSALMGWPEFGFGMRKVATGYADFVQWRGPREERAWPSRLKKADGFRWLPHGDANDYAAELAS